MKLTDEELKALEELARIRLGDESRGRLRVQLERIIRFVQQLEEIDTSRSGRREEAARPDASMRDDVPESCLPRGEALAGAPQSSHGMFKVPPVIEIEER